MAPIHPDGFWIWAEKNGERQEDGRLLVPATDLFEMLRFHGLVREEHVTDE